MNDLTTKTRDSQADYIGNISIPFRPMNHDKIAYVTRTPYFYMQTIIALAEGFSMLL